MRKTKPVTLLCVLLTLALVSALGGCGKAKEEELLAPLVESIEPVRPVQPEVPAQAVKPVQPGLPAEPSGNAGPAEAPAADGSSGTETAETAPGRQDGEHFEGSVMIEGMEETVYYEYALNETVGIGIGYDCENFERLSDPDREYFVSIYDDPAAPENYLEVTYSADDAVAAADAVSDMLSKDYEINRAEYMLEGAGSCIRIDASEVKGGGRTPDLFQTVYIIPAEDGCRIAAAHYSFESADGFGARFRNMVNTLVVIDRQGG